MKNSVAFSHLMDEYGNLEQEKPMDGSKASEGDTTEEPNNINKKAGDDLMQIEERNTGAVTWTIYSKYLRFAGGLFWAPVIFLLLTATQGAQGDLSFVSSLVIILMPRLSCNQPIPLILDFK